MFIVHCAEGCRLDCTSVCSCNAYIKCPSEKGSYVRFLKFFLLMKSCVWKPCIEQITMIISFGCSWDSLCCKLLHSNRKQTVGVGTVKNYGPYPKLAASYSGNWFELTFNTVVDVILQLSASNRETSGLSAVPSNSARCIKFCNS